MKSIKILAAGAVILSAVCTLGVQSVYADSTKESTDEKTVSSQDGVAEKVDSKAEDAVSAGVITLYENSTTGYEWTYTVENDGIVKLATTNYKSDSVDPEITGAGGQKTWIFHGVKEGETKVTFRYARGEATDDSEAKVYLLKVDELLNVTVSECEKPAVSKDGWVKNEDKTWSYYKDGQALKKQWLHNGPWYYLNNDGIMDTGWNCIGGYWYYFDESGAMKSGWLKDDGKWYYLRGSGAMATGWIEDAGEWYYLNESGVMLANTTVDGYKLGASGAWVK